MKRRFSCPGVFCCSLLYALWMSWRLPLWDDDFTSWLRPAMGKSLLQLLWEMISPVSTQPQNWGFNERPLEMLQYKLCFLISGYDGWSYWIYKSLSFAALCTALFCWSLRLAPASRGARRASPLLYGPLAATLFLASASCTTAAFMWLADFAPTAECLFLIVTGLIWEAVERTPEGWHGAPWAIPPAERSELWAWLGRWSGLAVLTYLGYKSKADLKLIPAILLLYVACVRPQQLGFFAWPVGLMGALAVPWGPGIFRHAPPFAPGSQGSRVGWMWQPASLSRLADFFWSSEGHDLRDTLLSPTLSLSAALGPFLLVGLLVVALQAGKSGLVIGRSRERRALLFVLIWLAVVSAGVSPLPKINYFFRIRYGLIPLVPMSLLIAWILSRVTLFPRTRLARLSSIVIAVLVLLQCGLNLCRSWLYREQLGGLIIAVDQAYCFIEQRLPNVDLRSGPDFQLNDFRPGAGAAFAHLHPLPSWEALTPAAAPGDPGLPYVLCWHPSLSERLELIAQFGRELHGPFDRINPDPDSHIAYLMHDIGNDPEFQAGEELQRRGDVLGAERDHQSFVSRHPGSLAGRFALAFEACQLNQWQRADSLLEPLAQMLPDNQSIAFDRALALENLGRLREASEVFERLRNGGNPYGALYHLNHCYSRLGDTARAEAVKLELARRFPAAR